MQYSLRIPKPCNESWEQMTPDDNGRHCAQCSKIVIDFTAWEPDAILQYLQEQGAGRTCGRFTAAQLEPHESGSFIYAVSAARAPIYSKWVAIFLLAFGLISVGEVDTAIAQNKKTQGRAKIIDDGKHRPVIMGKPATRPAPNKVTKHPITVDTSQSAMERHLNIMGDVAPEWHPDDTVKKK